MSEEKNMYTFSIKRKCIILTLIKEKMDINNVFFIIVVCKRYKG